MNSYPAAIRLKWIDVAKGAGIFFVIIGHLVSGPVFKWNLFVKVCVILILLFLNVFFCFKNSPVNIACNSYGNPCYYFISSLTGIFSVIILSSVFEQNKILGFYGKNSLPIFAFHYFFLPVYEKIISHLFSTDYYLMYNIPMYLCVAGFIFTCLISVPVALLYNHTVREWINKIPIFS